jgi:hypothetical protein
LGSIICSGSRGRGSRGCLRSSRRIKEGDSSGGKTTDSSIRVRLLDMESYYSLAPKLGLVVIVDEISKRLRR